MLGMLKNGMILFFQGRLFRDYGEVMRQWAIGFSITIVLLLAIGWLASPLAGVVVASLAGGLIQPYLFKDLKYN